MSADEIQKAIEELAQSGDGADRRWALNKLEQRTQPDSLGTPQIMSEIDIIDRLRILMHAAGKNMTEIAYHREFNQQRIKKLRIENADPSSYISVNNIQVDRDKLPTTLKHLYRMFPEVKRPGTPRGYPSGKGPIVQLEWIRNYALKCMVDRERAKVTRIAKEAATDGQEAKEPVSEENPNSGVGSVGGA